MAQNIVEHALEAEGLLVKQYGAFKVDLENLVTLTRKEMATVADESTAEISAAVSQAEKKITESRDKAIGAIKEFAAKAQK